MTSKVLLSFLVFMSHKNGLHLGHLCFSFPPRLLVVLDHVDTTLVAAAIFSVQRSQAHDAVWHPAHGLHAAVVNINFRTRDEDREPRISILWKIEQLKVCVEGV